MRCIGCGKIKRKGEGGWVEVIGHPDREMCPRCLMGIKDRLPERGPNQTKG
jgi:hypothetical protein